MSSWEFWTWVSILILTVGAVAVFGWFLVDILRIRREILDEEAQETRAEGGGRTDA
jgi:hypothetical protein